MRRNRLDLRIIVFYYHALSSGARLNGVSGVLCYVYQKFFLKERKAQTDLERKVII